MNNVNLYSCNEYNFIKRCTNSIDTELIRCLVGEPNRVRVMTSSITFEAPIKLDHSLSRYSR